MLNNIVVVVVVVVVRSWRIVASSLLYVTALQLSSAVDSKNWKTLLQKS